LNIIAPSLASASVSCNLNRIWYNAADGHHYMELFIVTFDDTPFCIYDTLRNLYYDPINFKWQSDRYDCRFTAALYEIKMVPGTRYTIAIVDTDSLHTILSDCIFDTFGGVLDTSPVYHVADSHLVRYSLKVGRSIFVYDSAQVNNIGTCPVPFDTVFAKAFMIKNADGTCTMLRPSRSSRFSAVFAGLYYDGWICGRCYKFIVPYDSVEFLGVGFSARTRTDPPPDAIEAEQLKIVINNTDTIYISIPGPAFMHNFFDSTIMLHEDDTIEICFCTPPNSNADCHYRDAQVLLFGNIYGYASVIRTEMFFIASGIPDLEFNPRMFVTDPMGAGPLVITMRWIKSYYDEMGDYPTYNSLYNIISFLYRLTPDEFDLKIMSSRHLLTNNTKQLHTYGMIPSTVIYGSIDGDYDLYVSGDEYIRPYAPVIIAPKVNTTRPPMAALFMGY